MNDKVCPFCGAEEVTTGVFNCWTKKIPYEPFYRRGMLCYERQIAKLTERLKVWKEYALECEDYLDRHSYDTNLVAIDEQQKLRDLGEI
jgi:hypothetical protein